MKMEPFKSKSILETLLRTIFAFCVVGTLFQVLSLALSYDSVPVTFGSPNVEVPIQNQAKFLQSFSEEGESRGVNPNIYYEKVIVKGSMENPSIGNVLAHKLPPILATAIVGLIAWFLLRIVYRNYEGLIFTKSTVNDIRVITIAISSIFIGQFAFAELQIAALHNADFYSFSNSGYSLAVYKLLFGIVIILVGFLAAKSVKDAIKLKEEIDGTV